MVQLFVLMFSLFGFSCNSVAKEQQISSNKGRFEHVFDSSKFIRLKYRPVYALGSRPTTKHDIQINWLYSASINCVTNCGRSAKRLRGYLESSTLIHENCPLPIYAVIEFLGKDESELETISINASGSCYIYKGQTYISPNSFNIFTEGNNISIFESVDASIPAILDQHL